jgi:SAM-dependent methyltransferase
VQSSFGIGKYDLISAIETIEHLENPSQFLRECGALLEPGGLLIITSPNLSSPPARLKFLTHSALRSFDDHGDPTHITPIFPELFCRIATRAGFRTEVILPAPNASRFLGSRPMAALLAKIVCYFFRPNYAGDNSVFLLRLGA